MNKLSQEKRKMILSLLVEGSSMRSISRTVGVSINTVTKMLVEAGEACAEFHHNTVVGLTSKRVQCDEIWSFVYAKAKNVEDATAAPEGAGDVWTWTAIDADTKLIVSYLVSGRDAGYAQEFMNDVASRLKHVVQLTTDGHKPYLNAVENAFHNDVDFAQLVKLYGEPPKGDIRYSPAECNGTKKTRINGEPDPKHISTSYVERQNLTMRISMRRFTRLTNAFSKKIDNHIHMLSLYFVHYNFCRIHKTLKVTPAMESGIADSVMEIDAILEMMDARQPAPKKRGPYKKRENNSN